MRRWIVYFGDQRGGLVYGRATVQYEGIAGSGSIRGVQVQDNSPENSLHGIDLEMKVHTI